MGCSRWCTERRIDDSMLRLDVPGHQASTHAQPGLAEFLGERTLQLDVPPLTEGVDFGEAPTPLGQAAYLAAQAWGARRGSLQVRFAIGGAGDIRSRVVQPLGGR